MATRETIDALGRDRPDDVRAAQAAAGASRASVRTKRRHGRRADPGLLRSERGGGHARRREQLRSDDALRRGGDGAGGRDRGVDRAGSLAPPGPRRRVAGTASLAEADAGAVTSVEIQHEGATVRETMLSVEVDSIALRGVVTEPVETRRSASARCSSAADRTGASDPTVSGWRPRAAGRRGASTACASTRRASATPTATHLLGDAARSLRPAPRREDRRVARSAPGARPREAIRARGILLRRPTAAIRWRASTGAWSAPSRSPSRSSAGPGGPSTSGTPGCARGGGGRPTRR